MNSSEDGEDFLGQCKVLYYCSPVVDIPYLKIIQQPPDAFRFRYGCDTKELHGKMESTVVLGDYSEPAKIRCSLYTMDEDVDQRVQHVHKFIKGKDTKVDYLEENVSEDTDYKAQFACIRIYHSTKKEVLEERGKDPSNGAISPQRRKEINSYLKKIDTEVVCLRFDAFALNGTPLPCQPVYSNPIISAGPLIIKRTSPVSGTCRGGDEVVIITNPLKQGEVKIFFCDKNGKWKEEAKIVEKYFPCALVIKTPPYDSTITRSVDVFYYLYRAKTNQKSDLRSFKYIPTDQVLWKKRKLNVAEACDETKLSSSIQREMVSQSTQTEADLLLDQVPDEASNPFCSYDPFYSPIQGNDEQEDIDKFLNSVELDSPFNKIVASSEAPDIPEDILHSGGSTEYSEDSEYGSDSIYVSDIHPCHMLHSGGVQHPPVTKLRESWSHACASRMASCYNPCEVTYHAIAWTDQTSDVVNSGKSSEKKEIETSYDEGNSELHNAVLSGDNEFLKKNLSYIITRCYTYIFDSQDENGQTALHLAVMMRNVTAAKMLIDAGCNVNVVDFEGNSPLHCAAANKDDECFKELLREKDHIQFNTKNYEGFTALHVAVQNNCLPVVILLVKAGADVNETSLSTQSTALHMAIENDCIFIASFLITQTNANVNLQDSEGNTPLHLACKVLNSDLCKLLLQRKADPSIHNYSMFSDVSNGSDWDSDGDSDSDSSTESVWAENAGNFTTREENFAQLPTDFTNEYEPITKFSKSATVKEE